MLVHITSLYAALLALICFVLGGAVGQLRGKNDIPLGDGGNKDLIIANRRHMNFVENVPLAFELMLIVELNGAKALWLHALGIVLVLSRIIHPFGLNIEKIGTPARVIGAGGTALVMLASAITLLWQYFLG